MDASSARSDHQLSNTDLRCAVLGGVTGERPAGSAPRVDVFVLVELPQPWPAEILNHPLLEPVRSITAPRSLGSVRWLGIRRPGDSDDRDRDRHEVIVWQRTPGDHHDRYRCHRTNVGREQLIGTLRAVLEEGPDRLGEEADGAEDLLICGHGARDTCCGEFGVRVADELVTDPTGNDLGADRRIWLASHLGGHRFAPTGVALPTGLCWAWLEAPDIRSLLDGTSDPGPIIGRLRGCTAFPAPAQVADLAVLDRVGRAWLGSARRVAERPAGHSALRDRRIVHVEGGGLRFEVELGVAERAPVPVCGLTIEQATKTATQFEVTGIRELSPQGGDA